MTKCDFHKCKQWRGVKLVYSHEEGYVHLCKRHIVRNLRLGTIDTADIIGDSKLL